MCRCRGEDVATVESARDWLEVEVGVCQGDSVRNTAQCLDRWDQEPVVWANEEGPPLASESKGAPRGTDAGVYDSQIDRVLGHVARGVFQNLRPRLHGEAGHFVRQVYHRRLR